MRVPLVAASLLVLILSGCTAALSPVKPSGGTMPWTSTDAAPLAVRVDGCGFCGGPEPWARATALYEDGSVLWFSWTPLYEGQTAPPPDNEHAEVAVMRPELDGLFSGIAGHAGWAEDHNHVHQVAAGRLERERAEVLDVVRTAWDSAPAPGGPRMGCDDCSATVFIFFEKGDPASVRLYEGFGRDPGNYDEGDHWDVLLDQMRLLEEWVEPLRRPSSQ